MSFIERLQLTPEEKQVYSLLLGTGQLTAFEIAQFGNLHYSKVQVAIDALVKKGAVGVSEGYLKKYFVRIPLEYLAATSDQISSDVRSTLESTANFLQEKKAKFNELRTGLVAQLDSSVVKAEEELDKHSLTASTNLQSQQEQKKEVVSSRVSSMKSKLTSIHDDQKQAVKTLLDTSLQNNLDSITAAKDGINTTLEGIKQKNSEVVTTTTSQIDQNVAESISSAEEVSQTLGPKIEMVEENYVAHLSEITELLKQSIDITKLDVKAFNRSQSEKYVGFSSDTIRKTGETMDSITSKVTCSMDELNSSLEMVLNRNVEDLSLQVQEAITAFNDKVGEIKERLSAELIQQKNHAISGAVSQIKEDLALKYTDLQNSEQIQRNNLISDRDMFSQKLETQYDATLQEYDEKIKEIQQTATSRLSGFKDSLSTQFSDIVANLVGNLNSHAQIFRDTANQVTSNANQTMTNETSSLKEKWSDIASQIETLAQETEAKIAEKHQEAISQLGATTASITSDLNNFLTDILGSSQNVTKQLLSTSKTQISESKNQLAGTLTEEVNAATGFLAETEGKYTDTANHLISMAMKIKNDFRTLEATTAETPVPRVETTSIIGLDAVVDHIDRIVRDAKRSVTIMSPKPEYIPLDAVKSLPTTVRVTIVTYLDEQMNREWIDSAYAAEANVEVRKFRDVGTGVELPQFIGVERENEEVIIAAIDEATQQVVGILSSSTEFAKLVSYIIIADFARGRSTQIK